MNKKIETVVFGGGCFWCTEAIFQKLKGVVSVTSGYAGGEMENPTYEAVCSGRTGHAEVIKIEFDPNIILYSILLEVFFAVHDPTTMNRQGNDVGEQYRSIILYSTDEQKITAEKHIKKLNESDEFGNAIVTQVKPLEKFFSAENYHQNYFQNNSSQSYCQVVISPKLKKFKEKYRHLIQ